MNEHRFLLEIYCEKHVSDNFRPYHFMTWSKNKQIYRLLIIESVIVVKNILWLYILVMEMQCMRSDEINAGEKERGIESNCESQKGR